MPKPLGYSPIPQRYASEVNAFGQEFLNPYVNFHPPCFFAESFTDDKGKTGKRYGLKNLMTPYEKLKSLPNPERFLKPGVTFKQLDQTAKGISDNEAVRRLNETRNKLFLSIHHRSKRAAGNLPFATFVQAQTGIGIDGPDPFIAFARILSHILAQEKHNYGHGNEYLASVLASLMLLTFLID